MAQNTSPRTINTTLPVVSQTQTRPEASNKLRILNSWTPAIIIVVVVINVVVVIIIVTIIIIVALIFVYVIIIIMTIIILPYPTNELKPLPLPSLHSSFTPN